MTACELERLAAELGLDAVGAAPAEPYEDTERHIRERRARGLFAEMKFTMAQPEVSCHPETLLPGARTVVSAALCYYAPAPEAAPGEGRLARYTWSDRYAELREKLDELGFEEAAAFPLVFETAYRMLVTRAHLQEGEWVLVWGIGGGVATASLSERSSASRWTMRAGTTIWSAAPPGRVKPTSS